MDKKLVAQFEDNQNEIAQINKQIEKATISFQKRLKLYQERDTELRTAIKEGMEKSGTTKFETDQVSLTYVKATTRKGIDTARFKAEQPDLFDKYSKETPVAASIRIKVK